MHLIWEINAERETLPQKIVLAQSHLTIGQLHDEFISLELPECFSLLFSCAN